jgi:hypothetical protein
MQDANLHGVGCLRTPGPDKGCRQNTRRSRGGASLQKVPPVEFAHCDSSPVENLRRKSRQPEKKPTDRCLGPVGSSASFGFDVFVFSRKNSTLSRTRFRALPHFR